MLAAPVSPAIRTAPLAVDPATIKDITVDTTYVGDRTVFTRSPSRPLAQTDL